MRPFPCNGPVWIHHETGHPIVHFDPAAPLKGALAGLTGTVAMTLALRRVFPRVLPRPARRGFLPATVTQGLERKLTGRRRLSDHSRRVATIPLHYAFGSGAGVGYGLLRAGAYRVHPALLGAGWGLAVWATSYQGWIPAAGLARAESERPAAQRVVPIAAHLLYGIATAYAFEALSGEPAGDRS